MTNHEYTLSTDAPNNIYVGGIGTLDPFVSHMNATLEDGLDGQVAVIPFTTANAQRLREFLKGRLVEIHPREKAILKYLADNPDAETNPDLNWATELVDLLGHKAPGRFAKIKTGWDLIHYVPIRYMDRTKPQHVDELEEGAWSVIVGNIAEKPSYNVAHDFVKIVVRDIRGKRISATFFRQKWLQWTFMEGDEVMLYGNYSIYTNKRGGRYPSIVNAKIDKLSSSRGGLDMIPIYPQKQADKSWMLQNAQFEMVNNIVYIEDPVPLPVLQQFKLLSRDEAYRKIHFPSSQDDIDKARERIAFDEYVRLQVFLEDRREQFQHQASAAKTATGWSDQFINSLPFEFTQAQKDAVVDIRKDLATTKPMYRLLQGDVGTGKSELATVAALTALEEGWQVVLLAPTDILANQLAERLTTTFGNAGLDNINLELFTGKVLGKKRVSLLERVRSGETNILVGTHAVIGKAVHFNKLGLVIIDEQHKFSTAQRTALLNSKQDSDTVPDFLMMTATPIPRTQALILFGDMDMTIVENQIPSRKEIITEWNATQDLGLAKIREEVEKGNQAYVIAALVEESDAVENVEAAETTYQDLATRVYPDLRVGLLHGKLPKVEKEAVIQNYYEGKIDILVSTSVVEVGVNNPASTVIMILNANRFGLSSLHQIRGRVGRGALQSYCYLVGEATTFEAEERLTIMTLSNNGFVLAEKDFEIRGEGSIFGKLQSGENEMFLATLREHKDMLEPTRRVAKQAKKSVGLRKEVTLIYKDKKIEA